MSEGWFKGGSKVTSKVTQKGYRMANDSKPKAVIWVSYEKGKG